MKDSLEKQTLKLGVIAVVLAAIIPVLAQEMLTGQAATNAVATISAGANNT